MTQELAIAILDKIEAYDRIILSRHLRPDGDAVGSTKGLQAILKATYPGKEVLVINDDYADQTAFLGPEDPQIPEECYKDSLAIVLDCAEKGRISNRFIGAAREMICIDHHIEEEPFGDISLVEPAKSSACEIVVDWYRMLQDRLILNKDAATYLYAGMVTDSGRFRFSSTSGETLRLAGFLLDFGLDLETIYANLYLEDFEYYKFQSYIFGQMKITENVVAYVVVTREMQNDWNLTNEQASNVISMLNSIKGSIIWIAFIENPLDDDIRVRLRSRFVTINKLGEKYGGGGHECAAGATVHSFEELQALVKDADEISRDYKANNVGWM